MRIQNLSQITNHGNRKGRRIVADILNAGLDAVDPYTNTVKLFSVNGKKALIGNSLFEADNDPDSGVEEVNLDEIGSIYVVGACKGVVRVAQAIEDTFGDFITDGVVIAKYGEECRLKKIRAYFGSHPVPDKGCVEGCKEIVELSRKIKENDLVITISGNGGSSLLTLPVEGITLEDVVEVTRELQIVRGASTADLNAIRNHIDQLKGGKISRLFSKAFEVHLVLTDANHHIFFLEKHDYYGLLEKNVWLHSLTENTTFSDALDVLKKYDMWEICPRSIRDYLLNATPDMETVKYDEFSKYSFRVFGIMPEKENFLQCARRKAEELGIPCYVLATSVFTEASHVAKVYSSIAKNVSDTGSPFVAPVVLLSSGEMLVTVGNSKEIGGRNQEFALASAREITGRRNITIGSVDTDGTDGPGGLNVEGMPKCLGGGIVDGFTFEESLVQNIDIDQALSNHGTSIPLWKLDSGIAISPNISMQDLTCIYIE